MLAIVFGGGSGLGWVSACRLAERGATVIVADIDTARVAPPPELATRIHARRCDVTEFEDVRELVRAVEHDHGALTRVIHTAAIMPGAPILSTDPACFADVMRVNYLGTVHVALATLPGMLERGRGELVCYGSAVAYGLSPKLAAYSSSKAAVNAFVETLAWENRGRGVRIMLVCPPVVRTPLLSQAAGTGPKALRMIATTRLAVAPETIVDAVERDLARGEIVSFPHPMARGIQMFRRLAPDLWWRFVIRAERAVAGDW